MFNAIATFDSQRIGDDQTLSEWSQISMLNDFNPIWNHCFWAILQISFRGMGLHSSQMTHIATGRNSPRPRVVTPASHWRIPCDVRQLGEFRHEFTEAFPMSYHELAEIRGFGWISREKMTRKKWLLNECHSPHLCVGGLVFRSVPSGSSSQSLLLLVPPPPPPHTRLFVPHHLLHTIFVTTYHLSHLFVTHHLCHTFFHTPSLSHLLSRTIFATLSFTHHLSHLFVIHHLCHTFFHTPSLSHLLSRTIFVTLSFTPLCHTPPLSHLCFAWQAWHLFEWAGSCGALGSAWSPGTPRHFCVAGVALGDIGLRFAWQAWHLATWTCVFRGRRGTSGTVLALVACHTRHCHTVLWQNNFVTHHLSHTTLSNTIFVTQTFVTQNFVTHTIFHTQICHTPSFTHIFVTHHLEHTTSSTHIFVTPNFVTHTHSFVTHHLCHTHPCYTPSLPNIVPNTLFHTHTQLCHKQHCHTPSFAHNFVTHYLSHTTLHIQPFNSSILRHLLCLSFLPLPAWTFCFCIFEEVDLWGFLVLYCFFWG